VTTNIAGGYSVTVSNAYGVASSSMATLKVIKPLFRPPVCGSSTDDQGDQGEIIRAKRK